MDPCFGYWADEFWFAPDDVIARRTRDRPVLMSLPPAALHIAYGRIPIRLSLGDIIRLSSAPHRLRSVLGVLVPAADPVYVPMVSVPATSLVRDRPHCQFHLRPTGCARGHPCTFRHDCILDSRDRRLLGVSCPCGRGRVCSCVADGVPLCLRPYAALLDQHDVVPGEFVIRGDSSRLWLASFQYVPGQVGVFADATVSRSSR